MAAGREVVSPGQVTLLVVLSRISLTLVFYGTPPVVKQDVWWQSFPAAMLGIAFVWISRQVWRRFDDLAFEAIPEAVLGRVAGRIMLLVYALFYLLFASLNLRLAGDFFVYAFLPRTPLIVLIAVTAFLSVWAARAGVEVMGRAAQVVTPLLVGTVCLVTLLLAKDLDTRRLLPPEILHTGPLPHLQDMVSVAARTVELAWVWLLPLGGNRRADRLFAAVVWAQVAQGVIWVVMGVAIYGVLGGDIEAHFFPFYRAARFISLVNFIERIDAVILALWLMGMVMRTGMLLWSASLLAGRTLGLPSYRPLVLPLGALAVTYAIAQARSLNEILGYLATETLTPFTLIFTLLLPLGLWLLALLRRPRASGQAGA